MEAVTLSNCAGARMLLVFLVLCGAALLESKEVLPGKYLFNYREHVVPLLLISQTYPIFKFTEDCHCRDWYGGCKQTGDFWTDDNIWTYKCQSQTG
jgi:hypothetical protein